ncbi:hypothetical protein Taro_040050 [Colocasia esculenta]|uniref:Uncharacterized protein n=1 Tax=Colocasia esculenta TaxID=4460 RepID=A0A843WHJ9_COLES|nr:hypothetical protein [Colocasia esculenta]
MQLVSSLRSVTEGGTFVAVQRFSVVLVVLPRLFARCLALEGLSRSEVVSVSWDPRPWEPVEGVLRATSVLELAAHFLLLWPVRDWQSLLGHVREAHLPYFLQLGARRRGSSVSDGLRRRLWRRVVVSSSESKCCELLYPSELRVVFFKSSGLQLLLCRVRGACGRSTCSCHSGAVGAGLTGCGLPCMEDACEPVQDAELSRCFVCRVLPEFFSVGSGGSESDALVVLVEVLPGPACVASTVLLAAVFSLMARVVRLVGSCILVKVLPRIALCRFWWRFFLGVLHDSSWRFWWSQGVVPLAVRLAAALASLSCMSVALLCTGFLVGLLVQALFRWLGPTWLVVLFQACGSWRVAFGSPISGRYRRLFGSRVVVCLSGGWHVGTRAKPCVRVAGVMPTLRWFSVVRGIATVSSVGFYRRQSGLLIGWSQQRGRLVAAVVYARGGLILVAVRRPVTLRLLTRRGGPSRSGCWGLKARAGYPSPSLSSSSLSPLLRRWGGSPPEIGAWWRRRARGGIVARAWSEEEVANRREGPLLYSFPHAPLTVCACLYGSGRPGMELPVVCLPTDVAAAVRVATSVEESPREAVATRCRGALPRRDGIATACGGATVPVLPRVASVASLCVGVYHRAGFALRTFCQRFGVVLVVLPRLFARCLALEGLSRSEVVSVSWDPHPREPIEGVLRATSMLELAAHVWDAEGFGVLFWRRPDRARLESRACGLRVPLLAASGGGLVAVVVTAFFLTTFPSVPRCPSLHGGYSPAVPSFHGRRWSGLGQTRASGGSPFGVLSVMWSHSWVPARDGTGMCSFPTWRRVRGSGWFCLWALDLVVV